jgi:glycyl-tRNA synthetase
MNYAVLAIIKIALLPLAKRRKGGANIYNVNGLEFWGESEIKIRNEFVKDMVGVIKSQLKPIKVMQVDAPILTPDNKIYKGYDKNRMFQTSDKLTLRPQTTPGSYAIAETILQSGRKPPFVIWQHGKSFRREQKKPKKHMRLKEFYQLEFQIIYSEDHPKINAKEIIKAVKDEIQEYVGRCRTVSTNPPHYATWTKDIERSSNDMELASISERTDFKPKIKRFSNGNDLKVLEIAIGTDRIVYNHLKWKKK